MTNRFEGRTLAWLLERRAALQEVMSGGAGSQTHVGIAPGLFHEFEALSQCDLEKQYMNIRYALFVLDPVNYLDPRLDKVMTVSTVYPESYY